MKTHEFDKLAGKLKLRTRTSDHVHAYFDYDGKTVVKTKRSLGSKEQPGNLIRQQLKVNEDQLAGLIQCNLSLEDYISILKSKGIIGAIADPSSDHAT